MIIMIRHRNHKIQTLTYGDQQKETDIDRYKVI